MSRPRTDRMSARFYSLGLLAVLILIPAFYQTLEAAKFSSYEDCILESMKGVESDLAAAEIRNACKAKFSQRGSKEVEIEKDNWNIADAKAGVYLRSSDTQAIVNIYTCGFEACGTVTFLNKSDIVEIKKILVVVKFKNGSSYQEKEYYAERSQYSECSPRENCTFQFPVYETRGEFDSWWIKRVWGIFKN
jgi:hypothetical protein